VTNYQKIDGNIVRDFAQRTLHNLKFIEQQYKLFEQGESDTEVYEVTQLINSMLGLLVFPRESFWKHLRAMSLSEIPNCPFQPHPAAPSLPELITLIRNGFSHFNLEIPADRGYIYKIQIYNVRNKKVNWRDEITVFELREFVVWFINGIIDSSLLDTDIDKIKAA
jgi:hypothetical protein